MVIKKPPVKRNRKKTREKFAKPTTPPATPAGPSVVTTTDPQHVVADPADPVAVTRPTFKRGGNGAPSLGAPPPGVVDLRSAVDEAKTANRFGLSREDVRAAISQVQAESPPIEVSASLSKSELHDYIKSVYDKKARAHNFVDMVDMMATCHIEIVARGIARPEQFSREALKALSEIAKQIYPQQKLAVRRALPPGDSKQAVLERVFKHLPSSPIEFEPPRPNRSPNGAVEPQPQTDSETT